jgi:hypothetical protein
MPAELDPNTMKCIEAFVHRDYATCSKLVMGMFSTGVTPELLQMLLISLQRLESTQLLERLAPRILKGVTLPWPNTLLKLTLGQVDLASVLGIAENDEQRCQAHYYSGVQFANQGKKHDAQREFTAAQGFVTRCGEHTFAAVESDFLSASADGTVEEKKKS